MLMADALFKKIALAESRTVPPKNLVTVRTPVDRRENLTVAL